MTATAQLATPSVDTDLIYEIRDGVARIIFNRPQARNALTFAMYERMAEICREVNDDPSVKVMILTGAGDKAFASGTDISQFRAFKGPEDALEYEGRIDRVLGDLERCRVPTIAAIAGACAGGGAGIAACCDLRIGTQTAKFGFPIARTLGNCLSMSNISRLTALIGPARVKDIIFTAAPLTLRATKEAVRRLTKRLSREEGEDLILMCYMSQDFREGMEAFLNKRPPHWRGA